MEFMDLSLFGIENSKIKKNLEFSELKALPRVQVSMDMNIIINDENKKNIDYTVQLGSPVANISKVNLNAKKNVSNDFPRRILFEMTSICNVLCKMCPRNHLLRPAMHMDKDVYIKTLKEISEHGIDGLWLYHLGESLMHPDFRKIVNTVSILGNFGYVWMSTNGHLMNESNTRFILDSAIDYINFSIHGVTREAHKAIIPQGDYTKVLKNLETLLNLKSKLRPHKPYIHLQMIEQDVTKHEVIPFILKYYSDVEVVSINMLEYVNLPENAFGYEQRLRKPRGHCKRITNEDCFICSNGAVTLCDAAYNCAEEHVGALYLGNVHTHSLYDIWNSPRRKKLIELEEQGKLAEIHLCSTCTDYDF